MPPTIAEVKTSLNFVWGKARLMREFIRMIAYEVVSLLGSYCLQRKVTSMRPIRLSFPAARRGRAPN